MTSPAPPASARLVIIGGGIVGCSTAYHLAKLGWKDMVMLDQGPLEKNWGSTSHAPGLIFQHNNSRAVCQLARWTIETYKEVAPRARGPAFYQVGSLEIAVTPERAEELKRKWGNTQSWGLEARLIDNREISRLVPIMRTDDLCGAFHVPSDANVNAWMLCEAMRQFAQEQGALSVFENTPVLAIEKSGGRVQAVVTPQGRITADLVLCAAGIWGQAVGRLAGIAMPLTPMQHLYVRSAPLPELAGETAELRHPVVRDQDKAMYYRQHGEAYGYGSYRHEPLPVAIATVPKRAHAAVFPFTPEHMAEGTRSAHHRVPCLARAPIAHSFNGIFSFTPDAQSILGEKPELRGFWVAEAVWVTHGGGVGKLMANWLARGDPGLDVREVDINRFPAHALVRRSVLERSLQQYREVYDIIHPLDQTRVGRNLRLSPFHARLQNLGAHFFESAGWERPQWFESNQKLLPDPRVPVRSGWAARNWSPLSGAEHLACREGAGLADLCAFAKFEVSGPGAAAFLQALTANDVDKPVGKVIYTAMLDERGGIKCDLSVVRLGPERFWVITGGKTGPADWAWLQRHRPAAGSVALTDLTSAYAGIGLWGPQARAVLQSAVESDVSNAAFPYLTAQTIAIGDVPVLALRISYVGELGWELYAPAEFGLALWDTLWQAGQSAGLTAIGGGAIDSLRLEKGYRLWGTDIHTEYNPDEAGLGFAVRLAKGEFVGRPALENIRRSTTAQKLCCLVLADPKVALLGKEPIYWNGEVVGHVTSANFGYSVGQSLAYGYLPRAAAGAGTKLEVYYFGRRFPATVANEPLYDPKNLRLKG